MFINLIASIYKWKYQHGNIVFMLMLLLVINFIVNKVNKKREKCLTTEEQSAEKKEGKHMQIEEICSTNEEQITRSTIKEKRRKKIGRKAKH